MITRIQSVCAGVLLSGALVAGQSPDSTTSREVISATGCVALGGTDGSAVVAAQSLGTGFVLLGTRVAPGAGLVDAPRMPREATSSSGEASSAAPPAEPVPGAIGGAAGSLRDTGLLLVADRGVELGQHVGHRVMVTGRLSSFAAAGGVASTSSGRTLTVTKVSLIAPFCTTGS